MAAWFRRYHPPLVVTQLSAICLAIAIANTLACRRPSPEEAVATLIKRAKVTVRSSVLDEYQGTYQFPSGALLHVHRRGDRLMAGVPPYPLLPQTSREFASNRRPAHLIFDRDDQQHVHRVNYRLGKRDLWLQRVEPDTFDPTQMIEAGAHRLRVLISGTGKPAVVIEDGFGSSIETRAELQAELAKLTCVVSYDHAGTGGSEPGPHPRDARTVATELRNMLSNAGLKPPFILVGGSIGVDYLRVFAQRYSTDVAGMVWLDPAPDWDALHQWAKAEAPSRAAAYVRMHNFTDSSMTKMMQHFEQGRVDEWRVLGRTRGQARQAFPLPVVPIVQITGAADRDTRLMARDKIDFFQAWLDEHVPNARHVLAEKSRHAIFASDPELVLHEVRAMVLSLRGRPAAVTTVDHVGRPAGAKSSGTQMGD